MNWITVIWSVAAGAGLLLASIHFLIWARSLRSWAHLCFVFAVLGVVWLTAGELAGMRAVTPESYSDIARWQHLGNGVAMVACLMFVHFHFNTGRTWLLGVAIGLRLLAVIINFTTGQNLHIQELHSLRTVMFLGEEVTILGDLIVNPWVKLGQLAALFQLIYVADASQRLWRMGGWDQRRRVWLIGVSLMAFGIYASIHAGLMVVYGMQMPLVISLPFLAVVMGMGYELMRDTIRSTQLAADLRESEHRLALVSNAAQFSIWKWNILSSEIEVSMEGRQLYGVADVGRIDFNRFSETVHPDDRTVVTEAISKALASGKYNVEHRVVLPDQKVRWIAASGVTECDQQRKPVLLRGVTINISDRKAAEADAAMHRMELAHLSRVGILGELAGSIAHELNQPLSAMLSNAQVGRNHLDAPSPDMKEMREILEDIAADAKRAGGIIHGMRAMFKKDAPPNPQPIDPDECVIQVVSLLRSEIISRKVTVEHHPSAKKTIAMGGRVEMQQVLINLLLNAFDAAAHGVDPGSRRIHITTRAEDRRVMVCVRDHGPGVSDDIRAHLFEPFNSTKPGGLGLGLAISRSIARRFGGDLTVENHTEGGAIFCLSMPAISDRYQETSPSDDLS
jgi:signal transduction histidine kinase